MTDADQSEPEDLRISCSCLLRRRDEAGRRAVPRAAVGGLSGRDGPIQRERVGPHPVPQFQIIFTKTLFQEVVPWMMLNREGLDILVHPLTDDMVDDHTVYALWLGKPVALVLDHMQRRGYRDSLLPASERKAA